MRSLVLVVLMVVLAASASAEPRGRRHIFAAQPTAAGLRGAQRPPEEALTEADALIAIPTALPSAAGQPVADVGQCRRTCARSYYFCLASDSPDDCGPTWSQCASSCSGPNYSLPPPP